MSDGKIMQLTAPQAPAIGGRQRERNTLRERIRRRKAAWPALGRRPIPAPGQAAEGLAAAVAAPEARTRAASRAAARTGAAAANPEPVLALACALGPGQEGVIADAVLARAQASGPALRALIIDLGAAESMDEASCLAVRALKESLAALGVRLRLVASSEDARQQCAAEGLAECLGGDAIHRSLRAALLAAYAALPGPGLVTSGIRTSLERPAEPVGGRAAPRSGL